MSFGGIGTLGKLLLCGTVIAVTQPMPNAMARSHHHTTHHRTTHHPTAAHGKTSNPGKPTTGEQSKVVPPGTTSTGRAAGEKLQLVPGPTPLPTPTPRSGANAAPGTNGLPPQTQSATASAAKPAVPPAAAATSITPPARSPTPVAPPAKGAIATAVAKLFVGEPVYGAKGEQIGRLSKIVTGPDGQVKSAVVSWGGLFGYFQSSRTIPWPEAGPSVRGGKLVLEKMTKDTLHNSATPHPEASR